MELSKLISDVNKFVYYSNDLKNTEIIKMVKELETILESRFTNLPSAVYELNNKTVEVNISPSMLNSFINDTLDLVKYKEDTTYNKYSDGTDYYNKEHYNSKHLGVDMLYLVNREGTSITYTPRIDKHKDYYPQRLIKDKLMEFTGLDNYYKFLVVILFLHGLYHDDIVTTGRNESR